MANAIGASIYSQIISGDRTTPLKDSEVGQVLVEVSAAKTSLLRRNMLSKLERSGLVEGSQMEALRSRLEMFVGPVSERGLQRFTGSIGLDQDGNPIYPSEFHFKGISVGGDVVYVSDQFEAVAHSILAQAEGEGDYATYFSGRFKNLGKTLGLAEVVLDHDAELLEITEGQRTLFLWELLARADYEFGMNGKADPDPTKDDALKKASINATDWEVYTRLRDEIRKQGLEPMAQRALDIRDGRDKPFAVFAGQGAGYINELNFLIENYPEAQKLYGELRDIFIRHGIDIEKLRRMADADQKIYANYIEISRVSHAFPMINLVQALRVRVMELHGYDFGQFVALLGQSGGLPAAYFAGGSFDVEGYERPLIPRNDGDFRGYHTVQAYQNFIEWSVTEGAVFEGPFNANAEGATEFDPLVKMDGEGKKIPPKPQDIDTYFQRYNLVTMTVSGIPYDWFNPGESELGQLVEAINTRYAGTDDYVAVNNVNTDETKDGTRSHFILMIGHGKALAELAKMIIFKRDFDWTGYDDATVTRLKPIVTSFSWNNNVRDPLTQTGLTMPPHNPRVYADAPAEHERLLATANHYEPGTPLPLRAPYLSTVIHNYNITPITPESDIALNLRRQQWHWPVNMPHQYRWAASHGATSAVTVGPSSHHAKTALPAVFSNKRMDILGVVDEDADGMKSWLRTTSNDPLKAHLQTIPKTKKDTDDSAVGKLKAIDGVQVQVKTVDGSDDYLNVRVVPTKRMDEKSDGTNPSVFEKYKNGILGIDPDSVLTDFLKAKKITVEGKPENNPYLGFIRNVPEKDKTRHEIEFQFENGKVKTINFYENGRLSFAVTNRGDGGIHMVQYYYPSPSDLTTHYELNRNYKKVGATWEQENMDQFRKEARVFYRQIWDIPTEWASVSKEQAGAGGAVFERRSSPLTPRQATDYAASIGSTEAKYLDAHARNFEVHPHYLSHDMWQSLDGAMFMEEFDMDPTRVIDEGKTFNFVAPIRVGDTLVTRSRLLKAEDFNDGRLAGRRIVVRAEVYRIKGATEELVRVIDSSLVSRMRTGPERVIFKAPDAAINLLEGRTVYNNVASPAQTIERLAIEGYQKDLKTDIDEWNEDLKERPSPKRIPYFDGAKAQAAYAAFMGKHATAIETLAKLIKKAEEGDADAKAKVEAEQKRLGDLLKAEYKKLGVVASKYLSERLAYLPQSRLVFKGSLTIPVDLAEKYVVDLNPIHVSDLAAVAGGIAQGRIMQGMATFAHVNEFVLNEMQRAGLMRDALGVANLKYTGFVGMGDKLFPEVTRTATAEGVDSYHVVVKNAQGTAVMSYDLVGKGVKTAVVFTGQGSQYLDMGNHLISDPARRARLAQFQEYMPKISASARKIQAALVRELKHYKYTAPTRAEAKIAGQARVMPVLYKALLEADAAQRHQPLLDAIDSLGIYIDADKREALKAAVNSIGLSPDGKEPIVDLVKSMNSKAGKTDKTEDDTSKVQPMIMAYSLILFEELQAKGLIPRDAAYAGHSLGMWITLVASGMLSPDDAMKAVYERGSSQVRYIDTERPQALVAVFPKGDEVEPLSEAQMTAMQEYVRGQCVEMEIEPPFVVEFSNDNSPKQWMIGGHKALFDKNPTTNPQYYRLAESVWGLFDQFGYTLNIRPIANAFHTSLMEMASADFLVYMRQHGIPFDPAKLDQAVDVYLDVEGKSLREIGREKGIAEDDFSPPTNERRKQLLGEIMAGQLARSVRWRANVRKMLEEGVRRFIEIGPSHHQSAGTLKPFIEEEVKYLKAKGIIKPDERIEIIYANSLKAFNTKEIGALTASAETAVVEVNRPDITVGEIKVETLEDLRRGAADEVAAQPQAIATVAPSSTSALKQVTPAEVKAIVDAFVGANKPAIEARQNLDALATQLSGQLVALGAGAADALKARQSELLGKAGNAQTSPLPQGGGAGGGSLVDDVIVTMKQLGQIGASEAVEGGTRFKDDLGYDTNKINELRNAYQSRHGIAIADSEIEKISTVNQFAALLEKKGVKLAATVAVASAATATLPPAEEVEQKAITQALTNSVMTNTSPLPQGEGAGGGVSSVDSTLSTFVAANRAAIDAGTHLDALATQLATQLQGLGASARSGLEARLAAITAQTGSAQTSPLPQGGGAGGGSLVDDIGLTMKQLSLVSVSETIEASTRFADDLGFDTNKINEVRSAYQAKYSITISDGDLEKVKSVNDFAKLLDKKGVKLGAAAVATTTTLSNEDKLIQQAIQTALASVGAASSAPAAAGDSPPPASPGATGARGAAVAVLATPSARGVEATDTRVGLDAKGAPTTYDSEQASRLAEAERRLGAVRVSTSDFFMDSLMQPHYADSIYYRGTEGGTETIDPRKILRGDMTAEDVTGVLTSVRAGMGVYGFNHVTQNGGIARLMRFVGYVRSAAFETRMPEDASDALRASLLDQEEREMRQIANGIDSIRLGWLRGFINAETKKRDATADTAEKARRQGRIDTLEHLYTLAAHRLDEGIIYTGKVIDIVSGNHVPTYGGAKKSQFVPDTDGTIEAAKRLADPTMADKKTGKDLQFLLEDGYDLRGHVALIHQASTITAGYASKWMQLGGNVMMTDYAGRSAERKGRVASDLYYDIYSEAADGASMDVVPNMQPGNRFDEDALLYYIEMKYVADLKQYKEDKEKYRKGELEVEPQMPHLPTLYINGAGREDYGSLADRGTPLDSLLVMALSTRWMAISLAKLHQKYKTGEKVVFVNLYTPNNAANLGELEGELNPAALPGSKSYHLTKNALPPGQTAAEAYANGIRDEEEKPILVEVARTTGWGKSDGRSETLMSGKDYYSQPLETESLAEGIKIKTLTGDELSTVGLSGALAAKFGKRKLRPPEGDTRKRVQGLWEYDDTYGFTSALRTGKFGEIEARVKETEDIKHTEAKARKAEEKKAAVDPSLIPLDGTIVDLNNINIAIKGETSSRYAYKPKTDILFEDETPVVRGYGMVGPLGTDALANYRNMLAAGLFKGHEGYSWLGNYDFYNLAKAMGVDVSQWGDYKKLAASIGLDDAVLEKFKTWQNAVEAHLLANSGIQEVGRFKEFEVLRQVAFGDNDKEIEIENTAKGINLPAATRTKLENAGLAIHRRPDGSLYALAKGGQTYFMKFTIQLPKTIAGDLPGQTSFDWEGMGVPASELRTGAKASFMAKMFTSQILMSAAGRSPKELDEVFGPKNVFVGIGTGLGDLEPFNEMTLKPMQIEDSVANYLMAALLPDSTTGQVATEQLGAEGMALAVVAACSTGNMNIVMAVKHLFSEYWAATRREESGMDVNWDEVFAKIWIAGGVDYAITFNAIFGFDAIGATIRDSVRRGRDIAIKMASRPDDMERFGFVLGAGGGGQGITPLSNAIKTGDPVYSMIAGAESRTDGDKQAYKGAREGYGIGQRSALFDAWDQAKEKLTEVLHTPEEMTGIVQELMVAVQRGKRAAGRAKAEFNADTAISTWGLKLTEQKALYNKLVERFGPKLTEEEWNKAVGEGRTGKNLVDFLVDNTRKLKENVRLVVMAHKTSTPMGDLYEEESIRLFLSSILDPTQFAHIVKTKAHMGHLLGGSSGSDSALSPLVMRFLGIPGDPGLDNIHAQGGENVTVYHHKHAENLRDLYDDDVTWVVLREAAGFNAKNTAIIEVMGKLGFETEESAVDYVAKLIEGVAKERVQKRAERQGLRKMFFNRATYQETPVSLYRDQYEVTLRSHAIARALVLEGRKLDWNNIESWVYQFPLNEGVELEVDTDLAQNNFVNPRVYTVDFENKKVKRLEVTADQASATNKRANAEIIRSQHNAIKYAEAQARVKEIYDSIGQREVNEMGHLARQKNWHRRPMVFYGMSDGMGMRTLIALIKSGAVKEVVGVHRDPNPVDPAKPEELVEKASAFNPAVLKALAETHGVNLQLLNVNAVPFDVGHPAATGTPTPLPKEVVEAVGKAFEPTVAEIRGWLTRKASRILNRPVLVKGTTKLEELGFTDPRGWLAAVNTEFDTELQWDNIKGLTVDALIKQNLLPGVNFFDSVAFGLPARAHYQPELSVPSMNSYGELEMKKIPNFASEKEEEIATIIPMGRSHPRLLDLFNEQGWLKGARGKHFGASETFWFDWRGSESDGMLGGVYGGATWETKGSLGRAKMTTKKELASPRLSDPKTGLRRVLSFPAFLSFALHAIPGGTLAGLIEKRIFEDIQSGALVLPGVDPAVTKFVSMNELSVRALLGALKGEFERGLYDQNIYVFVDKHEVSVYPEVARRIQEVQARLEARLGAEKAAWVANGKDIREFEGKMSREDTALLLTDILPGDYLKYTFEHIGDIKEKRTLERGIKHDAEGIAQLPMPEAFKGVSYPVLQRGFSPEVNTPSLAIAVIDAGGIGTLDAGNLKATETAAEKVLRERAARKAATEGGNGVNGVPDTLEARIDAVYAAVGNTAPLVVSLDVSASNFEAQLKVVAEKQVRGVMFRGGLPKTEQVIALNKVGIAVFQTVDTAAEVIKLTEMKVVEHEGKPNQKTTKAKFDAVVVERSISSGNINQAGENKFGDLSDLRDPRWDVMPTVPLRPINLQFKTTDFPSFRLYSNKSEVDFKLPETYAGYTGITHGGMLDSIFESVLEAMVKGGERVDINKLHRNVGYIANAPSNANVRIYVEKKPDGRIEMRMMELVDKPAEGGKPATREEKTLSNATFQDASKVKSKDKASTINPAELASNAQFGCLPNCVAAGHEHGTGLHFRFNYDDGKKALWGRVTPIEGQSRYHSMMLAADELTGWTGMMAFKIWGFTADNLYTPLRAPEANEAITLVAEVPEWDGLTSDMRMKVTFFGEDGQAIGVLTARYVPQMKAAQNVLARAIENLRAHPEDPEIRATFAFVKKALGHNFNKILQAVEQNRDMNADPELIVRKAREALYDAKIPVIASGAYTTHEDVKGAFHWGASGVALDDAILYSKESQYGGKTILSDPLTLSHPREGGDPSLGSSVAVRVIEDAEGRKLRLMDTPGALKLDTQLKFYREKIKDKTLTEAIAKPLMRTAVTNAFANAQSANDATRRQGGIFLASQNVGTVRVGEELESTFERLIHGREAPPPPEPGRDSGPDGGDGPSPGHREEPEERRGDPGSPSAPGEVAARATGELVSLADVAGLRSGLVQGVSHVGAQFIAPSEQGVINHAPTGEMDRATLLARLEEHGYGRDEMEGLGLENIHWQQLAMALDAEDPASAVDQVLEDVGVIEHAGPSARMEAMATRAGAMRRGSASPVVAAALKAAG